MIDIDIEIENESSIDTDIQTSDGEIDTWSYDSQSNSIIVS